MVNTSTLEHLAEEYNACDVSDALMKLKVPGAGFLADILPLSSFLSSGPRKTPSECLALPISTILFQPKDTDISTSTSDDTPASNIPSDTHWTDLPTTNTIVVIQQPHDQSCAVVGDILATRLKVRGVRGIIVHGRIRDLSSMQELTEDRNFTVWNRATSTVGSGLEAKPWASDVPLTVGKVVVNPGDVLFVDPRERGAVVIPRDMVDAVVEMLPGLKAADDGAVADVQGGMNVKEAFKKHRGE